MPYRRFRRRSTLPRARQVIQSYKKVINHAPASRTTGKQAFGISTGVDSVAAGQTSATDTQVPTGSVIKFIEIQFSVSNLVSVSMFQWIAIQQLRSGQSSIAPNVVGGDPQRNQVHFQKMIQVGKDQNSNMTIRFKVPKKFQRVREGDIWEFTTIADQVSSSAVQIIYKFYR